MLSIVIQYLSPQAMGRLSQHQAISRKIEFELKFKIKTMIYSGFVWTVAEVIGPPAHPALKAPRYFSSMARPAVCESSIMGING
jgi:hypothetical protein